MRYLNLRYGNPAEFRHYAQFIPLKDLARRLRRTERTVQNWLTEREKLPWWVPEILRLQHMEHVERLRQMNVQPVRLVLGVVSTAGTVYTLPNRPAKSIGHQPLEKKLDLGFEPGQPVFGADEVADQRDQVRAA